MAPTDPAVPGPVPVLSDGVVLLRALRTEDADDVTAGCQDPDTARWTTVPSPYSLADASSFIAGLSQNWWAVPTWAITAPPSDRWAGTIDIRPDGEGGAVVGYMVAPWARGSGLAARALRLACTWGFATLGLQVVTWYAIVGNEASRRSAIRAGFRVPDVVLRRHLASRGQRHDAWVGDLLPGDLVGGQRHVEASPLTARELQVLQRLACGESNRTVASVLGVSENTVKNHVRSILDKLSARSRSDAVVIALRKGLVRLPPAGR
jgi:RimJ/RimL family protein N-acetyltransferase/DNA-binding CsgD family transcriptional regulator